MGSSRTRKATTSWSRAGRSTFVPEGRSATSVRDAGADQTPRAIATSTGSSRGRAVLGPRPRRPDELRHPSRAGGAPRQDSGPRRHPGLPDRLRPLRRRRLGRVLLPVDVQDPRLRADHGPDRHAAADTPDLTGAGLRDCWFCPAELDYDPQAMPIPYHHSNLQWEEMIYYVPGIRVAEEDQVGSITLHPSGLPHGPAPGPRGESIGVAPDARARRDVQHVTSAQVDDVRPRPGRRQLRPTRGTNRRRRSQSLAGVTSHL